MLIRKQQATQRPRRSRRRMVLRIVVAGIGVLAVLGVAAVVLLAPRVMERARPRLEALRWPSESVAPGNWLGLADGVTQVGKNYVRAVWDPPPLETLYIDIRWKYLDQLRGMRNRAVEQGIITDAERLFVPASIRNQGDVIPVKLRLKGDLTDHLMGKHWSYRIQVRNGAQLLGMRRFSVQHPRTRDYDGQLLYFEHLRRYGVLVPRYFFAKVYVNGDSMGVMAVEEHFSKELLESQQRREGVIVALDEGTFWENKLEYGTHDPYDNYLVNPIRVFRPGWVEKSPTRQSDAQAAVGLLKGYLHGQLSATEVFDLETLTNFLAVSELWNGYHAIRWHNLRFYYNPLIARLEPIGFDWTPMYGDPGELLVNELEPMMVRLLEDPAVHAAYFAALERVVDDYRSGEARALTHQEADHSIRTLHVGFPYLMPFQLDAVDRRAQALAKRARERVVRFEPSEDEFQPQPDYPDPVYAEYGLTEGQLRVELVNRIPEPVKVSLVRGEAQLREIELAATPLFAAPNPVKLALPWNDEPVTQLSLQATVQGHSKLHAVPLRLSPAALTSPVLVLPEPETRAALKTQHPFLRDVSGSSDFEVEPGSWDVQGSLRLPAGAGLRIHAGTQLRFAADQGILVRGPLQFIGTAEQPIVLSGLPGAEPWRGVVLLGADRPSHWEHVTVRGTAAQEIPGWRLTGGVTFRRTQAVFRHCRFEASQSEDALNVIRGRYELHDVHFVDAVSDAIDSDFSKLLVRGGSYQRIAGDGIDVSGTQATLQDIRFEAVVDKAISVGEGSQLVASAIEARDVATGVASKDRSQVEIRDSRFADVSVAVLMAYVKKPEYGPAEIVAHNVKHTGETVPMGIAQLGSRISVDGRDVRAEELDVDALYAGS